MIKPIGCCEIRSFKTFKGVNPYEDATKICLEKREITEIPKNWHLDNKTNPTKIVEHTGIIDRQINFDYDRNELEKFIRENGNKGIEVEQHFHYYHPHYSYPTYSV